MTAMIVAREVLRFDQGKQGCVLPIIGWDARIRDRVSRVEAARCREDGIGNGLSPFKHRYRHTETQSGSGEVDRRSGRERRLKQGAVVEILACTKAVQDIDDGGMVERLDLNNMLHEYSPVLMYCLFFEEKRHMCSCNFPAVFRKETRASASPQTTSQATLAPTDRDDFHRTGVVVLHER